MFSVAVALVASSVVYTTLVVAKSRRALPVIRTGSSGLQYVIVVPCLDEALVIRNTLQALCELPANRCRIVVIDDDSADETAAIAREFAPRVELLQRRRPHAQLGKGDSLNQAYRYVLATRDRPTDRIVFGVVDADGRLDPDVLNVADRYFSENDVGGLQLAVSIKNRDDSLLARMQDFEFLGFAPLLLTAREHFGSVALGGNGQFVRLSELERFPQAPWTDSLTEDLDLGVRLVLGGTRVRYTSHARVHQQGLTDVRRLLRQRTRWVQGHFQCWSLIPQVWRSEVSNKTFLDLVYVLLSPGLMVLSSLIFSIAPFLLAWSVTMGDFGNELPQLVLYLAVIYALVFGPPLVSAWGYVRHGENVRARTAIGLAHLMPVYTYMWYVVCWRALGRMALGRNGWAKTARLRESATSAPGAGGR